MSHHTRITQITFEQMSAMHGTYKLMPCICGRGCCCCWATTTPSKSDSNKSTQIVQIEKKVIHIVATSTFTTNAYSCPFETERFATVQLRPLGYRAVRLPRTLSASTALHTYKDIQPISNRNCAWILRIGYVL